MISKNLPSLIAEAMKKKDTTTRMTLQLLKSELDNERIKKQSDLTESDELAVVQREAKKRKDAIQAYTKAGNSEKAELEKNELAVLKNFLPEELNEQEVEAIVDEVLEKEETTSMNDMGRVMGLVMSRVSGRADGTMVSKIVREKLQ